jgi:hypothetical protein
MRPIWTHRIPTRPEEHLDTPIVAAASSCITATAGASRCTKRDCYRNVDLATDNSAHACRIDTSLRICQCDLASAGVRTPLSSVALGQFAHDARAQEYAIAFDRGGVTRDDDALSCQKPVDFYT